MARALVSLVLEDWDFRGASVPSAEDVPVLQTHSNRVGVLLELHLSPVSRVKLPLGRLRVHKRLEHLLSDRGLHVDQVKVKHGSRHLFARLNYKSKLPPRKRCMRQTTTAQPV